MLNVPPNVNWQDFQCYDRRHFNPRPEDIDERRRQEDEFHAASARTGMQFSFHPGHWTPPAAGNHPGYSSSPVQHPLTSDASYGGNGGNGGNGNYNGSNDFDDGSGGSQFNQTGPEVPTGWNTSADWTRFHFTTDTLRTYPERGTIKPWVAYRPNFGRIPCYPCAMDIRNMD